MRRAVMLAVLLVPVPGTAELQVINVAPEGSIDFVKLEQFSPVVWALSLPDHQCALLAVNSDSCKIMRVVNYPSYRGEEPYPKVEEVKGELPGLIFSEHQAFPVRTADGVVLYAVENVLAMDHAPPTRKSVYRITLKWDESRERWTASYEKVLDLPSEFDDVDLISLLALDEDELLLAARSKIWVANLRNGRVREIVDVGDYIGTLCNRASPSTADAWWDVYSENGRRYLVLARKAESEVKYGIWDITDLEHPILVKGGSLKPPSDSVGVRVYGPFLLMVVWEHGEERGYLYDLRSGKLLLEGPFWNMMSTAEEFDPERTRYVLLGGKGLWLVDLTTGRVVDRLEDPEHRYEVVGPGIVSIDDAILDHPSGRWGIVVPGIRIEVPSEVQAGAREIPVEVSPGYARWEVEYVDVELVKDGRVICTCRDGKIVFEKPLGEGEYEITIGYRYSLPIPGAPWARKHAEITLKVVKGSRGLPVIPVILPPRRKITGRNTLVSHL